MISLYDILYLRQTILLIYFLLLICGCSESDYEHLNLPMSVNNTSAPLLNKLSFNVHQALLVTLLRIAHCHSLYLSNVMHKVRSLHHPTAQ